MCDAARELTDRFHFLGLAQLLFQAAALAHVFGEDFMALHPAVLESHGASVESYRDCFAVLAAPAGLRFRRRGGLVQLRDVTATRGRILEYIAIEVALEQRCLRLITQHLDECRVDREQGAVRRGAEDAERRLLHQRAAGYVGAPQGVLGSTPLGD